MYGQKDEEATLKKSYVKAVICILKGKESTVLSLASFWLTLWLAYHFGEAGEGRHWLTVLKTGGWCSLCSMSWLPSHFWGKMSLTSCLAIFSLSLLCWVDFSVGSWNGQKAVGKVKIKCCGWIVCHFPVAVVRLGIFLAEHLTVITVPISSGTKRPPKPVLFQAFKLFSWLIKASFLTWYICSQVLFTCFFRALI